MIRIKKVLGAGVATATLLLTTALSANAGVWNFREYLAEQDVTTEDIEQLLLRAAETAAPENPVSYLDEVYKAMFEPQAVKIPFRHVRETAAGKEILQTGTIYYSQGDLFILNELPNPEVEATNFATVGGELYTWESESTTGLKLTRFKGDTVELLDYWIDPAMIMRFTYLDYQQKPDDFEVIEKGSELYLQRKEAPHGFAGIRVGEAPHWMSAMVTLQCEGETCSAAGDTTSLEIDRPISIENIPEVVKALPEGVTFEPSDQTVDSYLVYL